MDQIVRMCLRSVSPGARDGSPFAVLGEAEGGRVLAVPAGPTEACAMVMEMEGITPIRPLTHDLLASFFREAGFVLDRMELSPGPHGGLKARLFYRTGSRMRVREVRPSDALALAQRLGAPIYAEARLIRSLG